MDLLQLILDQNRVNESQNLSHQTEKVQSNHHFSNPRLSFESDLIPWWSLISFPSKSLQSNFDPPATLRTALSAGSSCKMERGWSLCHASSSARSICILPPKRHHQARLTTRSLTTLIRWRSTSRLATRSLTTTTSGACCHRTTLTSCSPTQPSPPQTSVTQRRSQGGS